MRKEFHLSSLHLHYATAVLIWASITWAMRRDRNAWLIFPFHHRKIHDSVRVDNRMECLSAKVAFPTQPQSECCSMHQISIEDSHKSKKDSSSGKSRWSSHIQERIFSQSNVGYLRYYYVANKKVQGHVRCYHALAVYAVRWLERFHLISLTSQTKMLAKGK